MAESCNSILETIGNTLGVVIDKIAPERVDPYELLPNRLPKR